jgi:hypothetical protein
MRDQPVHKARARARRNTEREVTDRRKFALSHQRAIMQSQHSKQDSTEQSEHAANANRPPSGAQMTVVN